MSETEKLLAMVHCSNCKGGEPGVTRWARRVRIELSGPRGTASPVLCDDCQSKLLLAFPGLNEMMRLLEEPAEDQTRAIAQTNDV